MVDLLHVQERLTSLQNEPGMEHTWRQARVYFYNDRMLGALIIAEYTGAYHVSVWTDMAPVYCGPFRTEAKASAEADEYNQSDRTVLRIRYHGQPLADELSLEAFNDLVRQYASAQDAMHAAHRALSHWLVRSTQE